MIQDNFFTKEDAVKLGGYSMLWFDNSETLLQDKIEKACMVFYKKYKTKPTRCQVNPANYDKDAHVGGVKIEAVETMQANHLLIGVK